MSRATSYTNAAFRIAAALPGEQVAQVRQAINVAIANGDGIAEFRQRLQPLLAQLSATLSEFPRSDAP